MQGCPEMLRRQAVLRAGYVAHYAQLLRKNKHAHVDPMAYAHIEWSVAHLALETVYDARDTEEIRTALLRNILCLNRGLNGFLKLKNNRYVL